MKNCIMMLICILSFVPFVSAQGWHTEYADSLNDSTLGPYVSLVLDSYDNPHITYNEFSDFAYDRNVRYARWNGDFWETEVVDSTDNQIYNSLALDSDDNPHIAYFDHMNDNLKYARWTGSEWIFEVIDSIGNVGWLPSLDLDSNDNPHIVYFEQETLGEGPEERYLKYATWDGSIWNISYIDEYFTEIRQPSLVVDSENNPHIAYLRDNPSNELDFLIYRCWDGSAFTLEIIDSTAYCSQQSLALNQQNEASFAWGNTINRQIFYYEQEGSIWTIDTLSVHLNEWCISLSLDSFNNPHIVCQTYPDWELSHIWKYASDWNCECINNDHPPGYVSLALDLADNPRIAYTTYDGLKYAYYGFLGIEDEDDVITLFNIFPNPAHETVTLQLNIDESTSDAMVSIYDITGKLVYRITDAEQILGLRALSLRGFLSGVYFCHISSDNLSCIRKFLILD